MITRDLPSRVRAIELLKKTRFGIVTEIDRTGNADWNTKRWTPAARVLVQDTKEVEITCRMESVGAGKDEGIWWPLKVGAVVRVAFQAGIDTGTITGRIWSDDQSDLPSEANDENVVVKYAGHTFIIDGKPGNGGISLKTTSGIEIDMQDKTGNQKLSIDHPSGTNVEIDNAGNVSLECVGNLEAGIDGNADITIGKDLTVNVVGDVSASVGGNVTATVGGDIDVVANGTAWIEAKGGVTIKADTQITLQTLGALSGIMTQLTHPVCVVTGAPLGVSATVQGSA